ncbi:YitT family protein [Vannielia litorea]|uniref:YitT family protein n=1 Tax=Vannielia litorea TaxID=1217970 RepID=UPI001C954F56|nr:YitT family protein [Vannielia litorea]MBY6047075.1 YitT family protein [Vannielia litorea]MBY6074489.1 YitT family protein [Vannielia litorea]
MALADEKPHYTLLEDAQGLLIASAQAALGVHLLRAAGLISSGTAGTALIIAYLSGWSFGLVFFVINIPFYAFAWHARGPVFCLKSLATVTLLSLLTAVLDPALVIGHIHPAASALLFGVAAGVGLLGLFRHTASLGGVSIIALILQDKYGFRAGWTQLIHDMILFTVAAFVLPLEAVGWSLLGAVVLNLVVAFNHRRDWYVVT